MKKLISLVALFLVVFLMPALTQPLKGVKEIEINHDAYSQYLQIISYATPVTLRQIEQSSETLKRLLGQKITTLGLVETDEKTDFFSQGRLVTRRSLTPDAEQETDAVQLPFVIKKPVQYKAHEIYQVTGVVKQKDKQFFVEAQYAEPQGELSKVVYIPDPMAQVASYPEFDWYSLDNLRDMLGDLIASSATDLPLPESIAKLENKPVKLEAWFTSIDNENRKSASGTLFISIHNLLSGSCVCCGTSDEYGYDNTAKMTLLEPLSSQIQGGIFAGILRVNKNEERNKSGFFSIEDAVLIRPLRIPDKPDFNRAPRLKK
jgi:hypothetical protein